MSNIFTVCGSTSIYMITFVNLGLKSIHDIQNNYVTSNTYFVTFSIPGVNTLVMPGVNSIYKLIRCNKNHLYFDQYT